MRFTSLKDKFKNLLMICFLVKQRLFFIVFLISSFSLFAQNRSLDQYRGEIGIIGGTSFYIGDANPKKLFHRSGVAYGCVARYNLNPRYVLKVAVIKSEVSGDTRDFDLKFPQGEYASFERDFWDMSFNIEFNFFDYGLPTYNRDSYWMSPYIFAGAGLTSSRDMLDNASMDFNFPYGIGVKFKILEIMNLGAEWSMHQLFIDDFDVDNGNAVNLDNPYGFTDIGNKNNDRYSIAKVFLTIDIFKSNYCR